MPLVLVAWAAAAGTVIGATTRGWPGLARVRGAWIWPAAGVLWWGALLSVADLDELSLPALAAGALVAGAIAAGSTRVSLPAPPAAAGAWSPTWR